MSPEFAMTRMDEEQHPECDIYVEDSRSATLVSETLVATDRELLVRVQMVPYGAASVGMALGQMANQGRFPRLSIVFLDGDQAEAVGCTLLPGDDAPEHVLFGALRQRNWPDVPVRIGRGPSETIDALNRAMLLTNHHEWVKDAADRLIIGGDILWQALCASWALNCATDAEKEVIAQPVRDVLRAP